MKGISETSIPFFRITIFSVTMWEISPVVSRD